MCEYVLHCDESACEANCFHIFTQLLNETIDFLFIAIQTATNESEIETRATEEKNGRCKNIGMKSCVCCGIARQAH